MFRHMCRHNITQHIIIHKFKYLLKTSSRKFHEVFDTVVLIVIDMVEPNSIICAIDRIYVFVIVYG